MTSPIPPLPGKIPIALPKKLPAAPKVSPSSPGIARPSMRDAVGGASAPSGARDTLAKTRSALSTNPARKSDADPRTVSEKVKDGAADAAKDIALGAVSGAAKGAAVGGAHGAAAGAAKGAIQGAVKNKSVRIFLALLLAPILILPAFAVASTISLTVTAAAALGQADERASVQSVISSGKDEGAIASARSAVRGSTIPWQIAAAITGVTGQAPDTAKIENALRVVDPNGRYQDLATGAYYTSGSPIRVQGKGGAEASAAKVEETWVSALSSAMSWGSAESQSVYRQALVWYLGQSFGACAVGIGNAGDSATKLDADQIANAKIIIGIAKSAFSDPASERQAAVVGLATAMQESTLHNLPGGDRDSVGLFQQRPSAGWGTIEQIMVPAYAAGMFYKSLTKVEGWQGMSVAVAAQTVQISAFPDAYAKWETLARSLVAEHYTTVEPIGMPFDVQFPPPTGTGGGTAPPAGSSLCVGGNLTGNGVTGYPVAPGTYTITDTFGPRVDPIGGLGTFHRGIDLAIPGCEATPPNRAPIYSIQAGVVTKAQFWDNYGYVVEVKHTESFTTRYAHMMPNTFAVKVGDTVTVGQPLGIMGTSGASTGCHLHFETFVDGIRVNPDIVMLRLGIKL